jgi:hypothetical protein
MSSQQISRDTPSTTSSQASEDGRSPSSSQVGLQMPLFGLAPAPVSRSASQAEAEEQQTPDTSGLSSTVSLQSAALQLSLESRLRASMDVDGSPEYELTWSQWAMPWGLPICALRASGHHTSEADSGGWPTPSAKQFEQDPEAWEARRQRNLAKGYNGNGQGATLDIVAKAAGWPTPNAADAWTPQHTTENTLRRGDPNGTLRTTSGSLAKDVAMKTPAAGWPPPSTLDTPNRDLEAWQARQQRLKQRGVSIGATLDIAAKAAGWMTPRTNDAEKRGNVAPLQSAGLAGQAQAAGWMTPTVNDATGSQYTYASGDHDKIVLKLPGQAQIAGFGTTQSSSPVSTASRGVLNPELPRWLMGFPAEWGSYAPTATPSRRKSRLSS